MSPPPPIDAAEFDAHKDLSTIIIEFLCRNKGIGFSAKEIAQAVGIREEDVNNIMIKLGLADLISSLTRGIVARKQKVGKRNARIKIEDTTVNGITYYRCHEIELQRREHVPTT
jgi:transcription initiation factor IIE alpha subunit